VSGAARPSWSAVQRERLAAMGLAVYVRAGEGRGRHAPSAVADTAAPADAKLLDALLRAANRAPEDPGAEDVRAMLPPLDTLRGHPDAKRALWPRLRALRRTRAG
jgi:hypothetical protein